MHSKQTTGASQRSVSPQERLGEGVGVGAVVDCSGEGVDEADIIRSFL